MGVTQSQVAPHQYNPINSTLFYLADHVCSLRSRLENVL